MIYRGYCTKAFYGDPEQEDAGPYRLRISPVDDWYADLGVGYQFFDTIEEAAQAVLDEVAEDKDHLIQNEISVSEYARAVIDEVAQSGAVKRVFKFEDRVYRHWQFRYVDVTTEILLQAYPTVESVEIALNGERVCDLSHDEHIVLAPFPQEFQELFDGVDLSRFACVVFTEGKCDWEEKYPTTLQKFLVDRTVQEGA